MAQHHPTGSETSPSYSPRSSRFGSELPSVEDDVDVWRYAIVSCMPETTTTDHFTFTYIQRKWQLQCSVIPSTDAASWRNISVSITLSQLLLNWHIFPTLTMNQAESSTGLIREPLRLLGFHLLQAGFHSRQPANSVKNWYYISIQKGKITVIIQTTLQLHCEKNLHSVYNVKCLV